jgi:excisionase family DNA binding protein
MAAIRGLMTPAEAAQALGVTTRRVYQYVAQGRLDHIRLGGRLMVRAASVRKLKRRPTGRPRKAKKGGKRK